LALQEVPIELPYSKQSVMKISIKGFIYHKEAETFFDCFDRYGFNQRTNKFAISDGVSKSFFPDIWAELLVESFVNQYSQINLFDLNSFKEIQLKWEQKVEEIVNKPDQKYYVRNFFMQGRSAAATFVGLHFYNGNQKLEWEAVALGDSYLFFVPAYIHNINSNLREVISLSSKKNLEFDNFPDYFDSKTEVSKGKITFKRNELHPGTFYLMTDALAEWFVKQKQGAINEILQWGTQNDFEKSIQRLRKYGMQNDDCSILILKVESDNLSNINYSDILVTDLKEQKIKQTGKSIHPILALDDKATFVTTDSNITHRLENYHNSVVLSETERNLIRNILIELEKRKKKLSVWELARFTFFFSRLLRHYPINQKEQLDWMKDELDEIQKKYIQENKNANRNPDTDLDSITDKF
jgi:hypothetical protein